MSFVVALLLVIGFVSISHQPVTLYKTGTVILLGNVCKHTDFMLVHQSILSGSFATTNGTIVYVETDGTVVYSTGWVNSTTRDVNLPASLTESYHLSFCNLGSTKPTSITITQSTVVTPEP